MAVQQLLDDTLNIGLSESDVTPTDDLSIGLPQDKPEVLLRPKIAIIGVGGAGGNAINNMISSQLKGVSFIVANTDALAMENALTHERIQLGASLTKGLGAGSHPEIGEQAAEESSEKIKEALQGFNLLFIAAGMGGGTGTGASPVIARIAKELGILTIAVVTKPFNFENNARMKIAEKGIEELIKYVDSVVVIPNQNLFRITKNITSFAEAFRMVDDILYQSVKSITDLLMTPSPLNRDFADLRTVMSNMGLAMIGVGEASGENRAFNATEMAINNPLLDVSMKGAKALLVNVASAKDDLTIPEAEEIGERIKQEVDPDALMLFGVSVNDDLNGALRVSVIASGLDGVQRPYPVEKPAPAPEKPVEEVQQPSQTIFQLEPEPLPVEEVLASLTPQPEEAPQDVVLPPSPDTEPTFDDTSTTDLASELAAALNEDLPTTEETDTFVPPAPAETTSLLDNFLDGDENLLEEAHAQQEQEEEQQTKEERPVGNSFFKDLFSRRRKQPEPQPTDLGDLFPENLNLEVPSFLRQNKK